MSPCLITLLFMAAFSGTVFSITALLRHVRKNNIRPLLKSAWNAVVNPAVGTHDGSVTRVAENVVPARHLLGKIGASGVDYVEVAGANDLPLYVMTDEAETGDEVACDILGALGRSALMTASQPIAAGAEIFTAAGGKVQSMPGGFGTFYLVGRALTAAEADGDLLEVVTRPARVMVSSG